MNLASGLGRFQMPLGGEAVLCVSSSAQVGIEGVLGERGARVGGGAVRRGRHSTREVVLLMLVHFIGKGSQASMRKMDRGHFPLIGQLRYYAGPT